MKIQSMANGREGHFCAQSEDSGILVQHRTEPRIDSRLFAKRLSIKHKHLYELIRNNSKNLREFGILPFQTERLNTAQLGVREHKYVLLNENQFDFMCRIVRGRNHEKITQFKLDVTKAFAKKRAAEPIRREYLPHYHESRDALRDLGAEKHHYINLANIENRLAGLCSGERSKANDQQLGILLCMQKIEQATFQSAIESGMSPTQAVREVSKRIDMFATLMTPSQQIRGDKCN
ncbi:MAG: Rha family transcriptional regulator [Candidatus Arsenophonus phytopathogenicus]